MSCSDYVPPQDPASFSNYRAISILHAWVLIRFTLWNIRSTCKQWMMELTNNFSHFDWSIDWDKHIVGGSVAHTFRSHTNRVTEIVLDTSYLIINQVSILDPSASEQTILKVHWDIYAHFFWAFLLPLSLFSWSDVSISHRLTSANVTLFWDLHWPSVFLPRSRLENRLSSRSIIQRRLPVLPSAG